MAQDALVLEGHLRELCKDKRTLVKPRGSQAMDTADSTSTTLCLQHP